MKEWLPYVDDLTIRTVAFKDSEVTARVRAAVALSNLQQQQIGEALEACGFSTKGLSAERMRLAGGSVTTSATHTRKRMLTAL